MTALISGMKLLSTVRDEAGEFTVQQPLWLIRELGTGGMGSVWLAKTEDGREVAVKVLHEGFSWLPGSVTPSGGASRRIMTRRFELERNILAILRHANIVEFYGYGSLLEGEPFFTIEYISGKCLSSYIQDRCEALGLSVIGSEYARQRGTEEVFAKLERPVLEYQEFFFILRSILDAFICCHDAGIQHRDMKPDNVMLICNGDRIEALKLLDFGIARVIGVASEILDQVDATKLTRKGAVMGTPSYMSPEQINGDSQESAVLSDLFAIGVIGFEMLTGRIRGASCNNTYGIFNACSQWDNDPSHYVSGLSNAMVQFVKKATATKTSERFQSAREMLLVLDELERQIMSQSRRPSRPSRVSRRSIGTAQTIPADLADASSSQDRIPVSKWIALGSIVAIFVGGIALIASNTIRSTRLIESANRSQDMPSLQMGIVPKGMDLNVQSESSSRAARETSEQTFRLGDLYLKRGNVKDACEKFRQVQSLNPDHPGLKAKLAQCEK